MSADPAPGAEPREPHQHEPDPHEHQHEPDLREHQHEPDLREPDLPRTAKDRPRALRTGWTTGTCASAAARAAALHLVTDRPQRWVEVALPSGRRVTFAVERSDRLRPGRTEAVVVKDAGDDPDVTHGSELTATVSWRAAPGLALHGGVGVGVVTRPGLGLEVGGPAINPVPRRMIDQAVREVVDVGARGVDVTISVPDGERRARKTTNARLGILGGISILGTTGIVRPFSTASWRASVEQAVSVAAAQGTEAVVLCTGGRTERGAMELLPGLPEVAFVEVGDFTGAALRRAVDHGVRRVVFVGMVGKLTKLAAGVLMTHYTRSRVEPGGLAELTRAVGGDAALAEAVAGANTARHAYELWESAGLLPAAGRELCHRVARVLGRFTEHRLATEAALVDFTGRTVVATTTAVTGAAPDGALLPAVPPAGAPSPPPTAGAAAVRPSREPAEPAEPAPERSAARPDASPPHADTPAGEAPRHPGPPSGTAHGPAASDALPTAPTTDSGPSAGGAGSTGGTPSADRAPDARDAPSGRDGRRAEKGHA